MFDAEVDYYFILINPLNECSEKFKTGISPVNGEDGTKTLVIIHIDLLYDNYLLVSRTVCGITHNFFFQGNDSYEA